MNNKIFIEKQKYIKKILKIINNELSKSLNTHHKSPTPLISAITNF